AQRAVLQVHAAAARAGGEVHRRLQEANVEALTRRQRPQRGDGAGGVAPRQAEAVADGEHLLARARDAAGLEVDDVDLLGVRHARAQEREVEALRRDPHDARRGLVAGDGVTGQRYARAGLLAGGLLDGVAVREDGDLVAALRHHDA